MDYLVPRNADGMWKQVELDIKTIDALFRAVVGFGKYAPPKPPAYYYCVAPENAIWMVHVIHFLKRHLTNVTFHIDIAVDDGRVCRGGHYDKGREWIALPPDDMYQAPLQRVDGHGPNAGVHVPGRQVLYECPITMEPVSDPVVAEDGWTYSRQAIEAWFSRCDIAVNATTPPGKARSASLPTSPITGVAMGRKLVRNFALLSIM